MEAYEAEHPGYRTWLAEAATAQAAAVKALRGRKRKCALLSILPDRNVMQGGWIIVFAPAGIIEKQSLFR